MSLVGRAGGCFRWRKPFLEYGSKVRLHTGKAEFHTALWHEERDRGGRFHEILVFVNFNRDGRAFWKRVRQLDETTVQA